MITLLDLGSGSLHTFEGALDRLGFEHCRAAAPGAAAGAGPLVLMGSGPFDPACANLKASGWWRELPQLVADGRGLLGVGLGLHLLAEGSEESPRGSGLGLIPGIVRRLGPNVKEPHLGWSQVTRMRPHAGIPDLRGGWLQFSHCHALEPTSQTVDSAVHGRRFSVLEVRGRVVGLQAHPEKSGSLGLVLLEKLLGCLGEKPRPTAVDGFN
jgi:imidazole glycerol phosphate synthase glutamine amidotransferase subunit